MEKSRGVGEDGYDAVVVGSGYGGSVAACRMAMAGIKVCLIEKGQRWNAEDFPTNSFQMLSSLRMDLRNWGVNLGKKDALFQIHIQGDSAATVACGLGGGSLINAGVLVPALVGARRNPKWPKEWDKDWEVCEASALAMLQPQALPLQFSNSKIMKEIAQEEIEECKESPIKVAVNFDQNKDGHPTPVGSERQGSCLACGNCLSGCPYNAKNSTDKNYLAMAFQAGCEVKTGCQAQFVLKKQDEDLNVRKQRRWLVYLDSLEYVSADFVVLSAGVLGTTEILFQSERRGLRLSNRLGYGFSCNGNNVAYVTGSRAPLNAHGLNKKQFSQFPFQDRPGPSISSSYTSSLGFTIQSGVLPTAYPYLIFKGILTYGWPPRYSFLHSLMDKMKHMMGLRATQSMVLNTMGYDESDGQITFDKNTEKICFTPPGDPLLPRKIQAFQKLAKRLGGILFMSRFRSTSVHLLGGCNAATNPSSGVCNPNGQVFDPQGLYPMVHHGLYVCDASLIPCSVGINPCLTIATAAEHVSRHLVAEVLKYKSLIAQIQVQLGKTRHSIHQEDFESKNEKKLDNGLKSLDKDSKMKFHKILRIEETMRGYVGGIPCTAHFLMKMNSGYQDHDERNLTMSPLLRGEVDGYCILQGEKDKLYIIDGKVDMCNIERRTPYTQYMHYHLLLASASGSRYILEGKKIMNPYLGASYAWKESRTLHVTLKKIHPSNNNQIKQSNGHPKGTLDLKGELHLTTFELLRSLISMRGPGKGKFICALLESMFRTYILQIPRSNHVELGPADMSHRPYPPSILHEIRTGDGVKISCRQWKCIENSQTVQLKKKSRLVLLLNGYSFESFFLPTEETDLIRNLIKEGYEIWLLQPRLHVLHPSNDFTIEDIGKFDIPAALTKIQELHGPSVKLHVVAHCVGGLAIHIALMGGHISASQIASLSCTNSSMFFKLTASSLVKMRLPLIPISMAILGKDTVLSVEENTSDSLRQRLLKSIARLIPRHERCTCDECEVLSGIFGNGFWHSNVSNTAHNWVMKESLPRLAMSAFPHLRKICLKGFILDSNGNNSYLIHPERMAVSTLYISGGRSLLVTSETSFLANQYMRLHQPGFHHKRVVVEGFGHSDLLIGEDSCKKVFPHILSHIKTTEEETSCGANIGTDSNHRMESFSWGDSDEMNGGFGASYFLLLLILFLFIFLFSRIL